MMCVVVAMLCVSYCVARSYADMTPMAINAQMTSLDYYLFGVVICFGGNARSYLWANEKRRQVKIKNPWPVLLCENCC